jgi:hypothetical protein
VIQQPETEFYMAENCINAGIDASTNFMTAWLE